MSRIYVSGPMRGYPNFNFDAFFDLSAQLESSGYQVVNPAQHDVEVYPDIKSWPGFATGDVDACVDFDLHKALSWDLAQVAECDELVMLPGWEASSGARHERYVAEVTGKPIWLAHKVGGRARLGVGVRRRAAAHGPAGSSTSASTWRTETRTSRSADYVTKDSGARVEFDSGMRRDTDEGKPRYDLIPVMPVRTARRTVRARCGQVRRQQLAARGLRSRSASVPCVRRTAFHAMESGRHRRGSCDRGRVEHLRVLVRRGQARTTGGSVMPYVAPGVQSAAAKRPLNPGELNYAVTKIVCDYVSYVGLGYGAINDVLGALEGAKHEFYRRVAVPYEEAKRAQNGDVYPKELTSGS
jgi:hypothetical protein